MGLRRVWSWLARRRSVRHAWASPLPERQREVFDSILAELEARYAMLSVALDDALHLRDEGTLQMASDQVAVSAELASRLAIGLDAALGAIEACSQHRVHLPDVNPLEPEFFRGPSAQRQADWDRLLQLILLSRRSRFFHKIHTLRVIVDAAAADFRESALELVEGACVNPYEHWATLDAAHYDLNTCLREASVVTKSFLHLLPSQDCALVVKKMEAFEASAKPVQAHRRPRVSR